MGKGIEVAVNSLEFCGKNMRAKNSPGYDVVREKAEEAEEQSRRRNFKGASRQRGDG